MKYTVLLCALYLFLTKCSAQEKDGYIFTSPRSLNIGSDNELHLRRFGKLQPGTLKVQIFYSDYSTPNETLAVEKDFEIPAGEKDSIMKVRLNQFDNYVYNGRLQINGTFGEHTIFGKDTIYFSTPRTELIVIQTDKPLYKPGETVKFRVLKLKKDLKPSGKDSDKVEVYVEDPKGTRLFQYKDVDIVSGLVQHDFPLSEEPVKGNWKINVKSNDYVESTTFEVKDYVLPKFDLSVVFPSYVLADAEIIPVEICAKYTYGKPVVGTLNLTASLERYSYSREKYPTLEESFKLEGCYNYTLNVTYLEAGNNYRYRRIMVFASVTEEGTGIQRNESQYLMRQYSPLNIRFSNDQRQFYKPGLPYNGKIEVTYPDDKPAPNEKVELCASITKERVLANWWATKMYKYCKNYTSDENGIIQYTILSQNTDVVSINLKIRSLRSNKESSSSGGRDSILSTPQASLSLNPYFSPSGSFVQIQPVDQPVPCGQKKNFKLLFTSKENADFKFYYQLTRQSDVVRSNTVETSFSIENDVSSNYENDEKILNGQETQILPSPETSSPDAEEACPASKEAKYLPPIGEVNLEVDIDASLSPVFYLLVYYVRNDRETVADYQKVEVEKCFNNKVEFTFGHQSQQPGLKTSIQVTAAPNSLCGIKTIDKSITLLNDNDQLTKEKVFQRLENMDNNHYYTNNPCGQNNPQPGTRTIIHSIFENLQNKESFPTSSKI